MSTLIPITIVLLALAVFGTIQLVQGVRRKERSRIRRAVLFLMPVLLLVLLNVLIAR